MSSAQATIPAEIKITIAIASFIFAPLFLPLERLYGYSDPTLFCTASSIHAILISRKTYTHPFPGLHE